MADQKISNMSLTLERHFHCLAEQDSDVQELRSLWLLLRKNLEERLLLSRGAFVHYSLHDVTHSRSVIHAIERFLGEDRIARLSATDTFMLLCCAFAHDYGMAITVYQTYDALGDPKFQEFLEEQLKNACKLAVEEKHAVKNLLTYLKEQRSALSLQEQYFAILSVTQMFFRPTHWKRASSVWVEFNNLLSGRLNMRFIQGSEGIIDICEMHGLPFDQIFKMQQRADGIVGDNFHPRFIAAMLRLGDLLDLDNGRFPRWFVDEIAQNRSLIPHLSKLHYKKHEAISHLLITPNKIEICASCNGEYRYDVADLISEWLEWLSKECKDQLLHWSEITQPDFGQPPSVTKIEIWVEGKPFVSSNHKLQMRMSQDRVMKLLEGTSIYQDKYVGLRELLQNAVDASLLQLWNDIKHNCYIDLKVSKHGHPIDKDGTECWDGMQVMTMLEHSQKVLSGIFRKYNITVELILDEIDGKVYVVVKDRGTGITPEDVTYISDIGSSKEKNQRTLAITRDMPPWLKPSGVFGIGLQSVFQLTDKIEFYTRRPNEPEREIIFHSYGKNSGKIEIREIIPGSGGIYHDNSVPGTNVRIAIDPNKLMQKEEKPNGMTQDHFLYYDMEFDQADMLRILFIELSHVIEEKLSEAPCDYFNVQFQKIEKLKKDGLTIKEKPKHLRWSYFSPPEDLDMKDKKQIYMKSLTILPFYEQKVNGFSPFSFTETTAYFIDDELYRIHRLELRPCTLRNENGERVIELPEPVRNLYHFQYKFNPISNSDALYSPTVRKLRNVHAGFLDWHINIMDDVPTKYLNIDRDRLREGAFMEEELTDIRSKILLNWCNFLIRKYELREKQRLDNEKRGRAKHRRQNTMEQFKRKAPTNLFFGKPQMLASIALLFYQNVTAEQFQKFIEPYSDYIRQQELKLRGEAFCIEKIWENRAVFFLSEIYPAELQAEPCLEASVHSDMQYEEYELHSDTVLRFPHRLVHIFEISRTDSDHLRYYMRLGSATNTPCAIEMDVSARLLDYLGVLDVAFVHGKDLDSTAMVRKVFKPNAQFPHLIINKYPKNFRRAQNFSSPLDHCIRWYILSPFDRDLCKWLKKAVTKDTRTLEQIMQDCKEEVKRYVTDSLQFKKCVRYVLSQKQAAACVEQKTLEEDLEENITSEYIDLILDFCKIVIQHRDMIKDYFPKQKALISPIT